MFGLKLLSAPQLLVTIVVAAVVVGYALFVCYVPALRLRLDQAGDNAYYLGLIFTLLSMAWALWQVGKQLAYTPDGHITSVTESVIGDFGLALGSTLAGIICRIVLHQMRIDPVEVESASRLELAVAAERTRAQLADISTQLAQFFEALRQKSEDSTRELQDGYERTMAEVSARVQLATEESINSMRNASSQMQSSIGGFSDASDHAIAAFEDASRKLAGIEPPPVMLSQRYASFADKVGAVSEQLGQAVSAFENAAELMSSASQLILETSSSAAGIVPAIRGQISSLESSIDLSHAKVETALRATNSGLKDVSDAVEALREGAEQSALLVADSEKSAKLVLDGLERAVRRIARSTGAKDGE
jgi:hypothetical protein